LFIAAAGTYFVVSQAPLEGNRPPTTLKTKIEQSGVEARLWQDPFAAVEDALSRTPALRRENCSPPQPRVTLTAQGIEVVSPDPTPQENCKSPLADRRYMQPIVLVASVPGAPYSEDQEWRRRTRYAIVSGLNAEGFVPDDPQHIKFYWPQQTGDSSDALPIFVPFERFTKNENGMVQHALLLWFNEDVLDNEPLKQFHAFLCRSVFTSMNQWSKAAILGQHFMQ
jgi:hypothetical protein